MTVIDLLAVVGVAAVPASVGLTVAWLGARREVKLLKELLHRELHGAAVAAAVAPTAGSDLQRVERAVEAIALEVERVAEGQRFLSRVLAERQVATAAAPAAGSDASRATTPH